MGDWIPAPWRSLPHGSTPAPVELRLPLVDYRFVETVIGLRKAHSDVGLAPKRWLREAIEDAVPEWVRMRPKRGFQPPVREWHPAIFARHGAQLADGVQVELGVLKPEAARAFARGTFPLTQTVPSAYNALVLETWCRQSLVQTEPSRDPSVTNAETR